MYRKTCTLPIAKPSSTCPLPFFDTVQGEKKKKVKKDDQSILSRAHFALVAAWRHGGSFHLGKKK